MDGRLLDGRELRVQMARYGRPTSPHRSRGSRRRGRQDFIKFLSHRAQIQCRHQTIVFLSRITHERDIFFLY